MKKSVITEGDSHEMILFTACQQYEAYVSWRYRPGHFLKFVLRRSQSLFEPL